MMTYFFINQALTVERQFSLVLCQGLGMKVNCPGLGSWKCSRTGSPTERLPLVRCDQYNRRPVVSTQRREPVMQKRPLA